MFKFKKIASVLASAVMLSSTVALAAAANFPAPFVQGGSADVAIVYGATAAQTDLLAATDIRTALTTALATQATTATTATTVVGGDSYQIGRGSTDKFNLGDSSSSFYATLDADQLSTALKKGSYLNHVNKDFDYEQKIVLGTNLNLTYFQDSSFNDNKPIIGFNLNTNDVIMNYTLDFTPDAAEGGTAFVDLENTNVDMLGRTYFISDVSTTANGVKITMLDSANTAALTEGETKTVTVGDKSYEISVKVYASNNVKITINGELTTALNAGETYKLTDGTYVGVKEINYNGKDAGISDAEISLGTGQIVIENGQEVKVNTKAISTLEDANGYTSVITGYVKNTTTNLDQIILQWKLDDDAWIAPGFELPMPGFNAVKLTMASFVEPDPEITKIDDDASSVQITTPIKEGELSMSILYANSSITGFEGLGRSSTEVLVTNATTSTSTASPVYILLNETLKSYFVATWVSGQNSESFAYKIGSITDSSGKNATTLRSLVTGGTDITFSEVGKTKDVGNLRLTLLTASDNFKNAAITIAPASSGTAYADRIISKAGLQIRFPVSSGLLATDGFINLTVHPASWIMNVSEKDKDGNIAYGAKSFTITNGIDAGSGTEPTAIPTAGITTYETERGSKLYEGYKSSDLATKVSWDKPTSGLNSIDITAHGSQAYGEVFLTEATATIGGNATTTVAMPITDLEAASVTDKNLIVVGGTCINTVAASLLSLAPQTCGDAFTTATTVGSGQFLIQTFARTGGKVATLVAGYNAPDTTAAATYLRTQTVDTTAGQKVVKATNTVV